MTGAPYLKNNKKVGARHTHTGEHHVDLKAETEIGAMLL